MYNLWRPSSIYLLKSKDITGEFNSNSANKSVDGLNRKSGLRLSLPTCRSRHNLMLQSLDADAKMRLLPLQHIPVIKKNNKKIGEIKINSANIT